MKKFYSNDEDGLWKLRCLKNGFFTPMMDLKGTFIVH
jgi:hypothetical protein